MMMSRATRQVLNELDQYAKMSNVQGLTIPAHIYLGDVLTTKYYQNAIINLIKSRMAKIPKTKRESKHFTLSYWYPIVDNMLQNQTAPKREISGIVYGEMLDYNPFNHIISKYLITDYSTADAQLINQIVNEYTFMEITAATRAAAQANVYSVRYIKAILEGEKAKHQLEVNKIHALGAKIDESDKLLQQDKVVYTQDEVTHAEQTFEEKRHNMLLQMMVDKMLGGDNK